MDILNDINPRSGMSFAGGVS